MDTKNVGIITEQGDLGLGFNPVTETEKETLEKNNYHGEKKENQE